MNRGELPSVGQQPGIVGVPDVAHGQPRPTGIGRSVTGAIDANPLAPQGAGDEPMGFRAPTLSKSSGARTSRRAQMVSVASSGQGDQFHPVTSGPHRTDEETPKPSADTGGPKDPPKDPPPTNKPVPSPDHEPDPSDKPTPAAEEPGDDQPRWRDDPLIKVPPGSPLEGLGLRLIDPHPDSIAVDNPDTPNSSVKITAKLVRSDTLVISEFASTEETAGPALTELLKGCAKAMARRIRSSAQQNWIEYRDATGTEVRQTENPFQQIDPLDLIGDPHIGLTRLVLDDLTSNEQARSANLANLATTPRVMQVNAVLHELGCIITSVDPAYITKTQVVDGIEIKFERRPPEITDPGQKRYGVIGETDVVRQNLEALLTQRDSDRQLILDKLRQRLADAEPGRPINQPTEPIAEPIAIFDSPTEADEVSRVELLQSLVERGITTDDCIGVHGTSTQALQYFLRTGRLAGYSEGSDEDPNLPQEGDLYFYPFQESFPEHSTEFMDQEEGIKNIRRLAAHRGRVHHLLTSLGLPLHPGGDIEEAAYALFPETSYQPPAPTSPDFAAYTAFMNLRPRQEMERLIREASEAQGVIVGISRNVLTYGVPRLGDAGNDMRINMGDIPPQEAFSGIQPMGRIETDFFEALINNERTTSGPPPGTLAATSPKPPAERPITARISAGVPTAITPPRDDLEISHTGNTVEDNLTRARKLYIDLLAELRRRRDYDGGSISEAKIAASREEQAVLSNFRRGLDTNPNLDIIIEALKRFISHEDPRIIELREIAQQRQELIVDIPSPDPTPVFDLTVRADTLSPSPKMTKPRQKGRNHLTVIAAPDLKKTGDVGASYIDAINSLGDTPTVEDVHAILETGRTIIPKLTKSEAAYRPIAAALDTVIEKLQASDPTNVGAVKDAAEAVKNRMIETIVDHFKVEEGQAIKKTGNRGLKNRQDVLAIRSIVLRERLRNPNVSSATLVNTIKEAGLERSPENIKQDTRFLTNGGYLEGKRGGTPLSPEISTLRERLPGLLKQGLSPAQIAIECGTTRVQVEEAKYFLKKRGII